MHLKKNCVSICFSTLAIPSNKLWWPYVGKATATARAVLSSPANLCNCLLFTYHHPKGIINFAEGSFTDMARGAWDPHTFHPHLKEQYIQPSLPAKRKTYGAEPELSQDQAYNPHCVKHKPHRLSGGPLSHFTSCLPSWPLGGSPFLKHRWRDRLHRRQESRQCSNDRSAASGGIWSGTDTFSSVTNPLYFTSKHVSMCIGSKMMWGRGVSW